MIEKIGGANTLSSYDMADFYNCCSTLDIFDAPYSGEFFTWTNGTMKAKLDRALINQGCHDNNLICHSTINKIDCFSDYCPILIEVIGRIHKRKKPFKFYKMWLDHPRFKDILNNHWRTFFRGTRQFILVSKLKAMKGPLKELNIKEFSHISERAKRANSDFQHVLDNLDVLNATENDKILVQKLRKKAMFLKSCERKFFEQKLKIKHLITTNRGS